MNEIQLPDLSDLPSQAEYDAMGGGWERVSASGTEPDGSLIVQAVRGEE